MKIANFLRKLNETPELLTFTDTMAVVEANYDYTPTAFANGNTHNEAGTNEGSCKLFGFAKAQQLNEQQTLNCFAQFYRDDVLGNPEGTDHQNIRNFMVSGWEGIKFEGEALKPKNN